MAELVDPSDLLHRCALAFPDRIGLVAPARDPGPASSAVRPAEQLRWSFGEWDRRVGAAANGLRRRGLLPGDRVILQLPTGPPFALLYPAVLRAGLVAVPVNPAYTAAEVGHIANDSGAALHVVLDTEAAAQELLAGTTGAADLAEEPDEWPMRERGAEDLAVLLYTSGTSGRPKGAMLSGRALLANLDQLAAVDPPLLDADDVLFVPLPLTHIFGLNAGLGMALHAGATLVLAGDRFDASATLSAMAAEQVSAVLAVPGQYAAWLAEPGLRDGFASVGLAMSGSSTLTRSVIEGYADVGVALHNGYGLTEAAPVVCVTAQGPAREHPSDGSIGAPLPGVDVELRDTFGGSEGEPADDGDPGRIYVRGPNLFSGYWPDGADGPDEDGWFATGDIAVAEKGDRLRIVGRSSDIVLINGFTVYPAEIEAVFATLPDVAEVAVVGAHDPTGQEGRESLHAYVVAAPGTQLDPEHLRRAAAGSLARFKLPEVIEIVATLPRTVTGKIMKWQLFDAAG